MSDLRRRIVALERVTTSAGSKPCACPWPLTASDGHFVIGLWVKREAGQPLSDAEIAEEDRLMALVCKCPRPPVSRSVGQLLGDARRLGLLA
jgi:hypothetical protein